MAVGSTANAPIATAPKATPSTAAATTAVVSSLCFIAPPSSILKPRSHLTVPEILAPAIHGNDRR
jgi:hypothetical protein